jgi:PAS domain S-box-containing protein
MSLHLPGKAFSPESPDAELYLRRILDAIPQLAWRAFADGSVEFCNQSWLEYTGLTVQQAQGWGWRAAIHPEDLDELVATWHRVLAAGAPGEAEARMRAADGTFRWFLIRAMPLRDDQGRIVRWHATNIDIDERKRAEQRLRDSEERFRLAAQAGKMFAYEWDGATDVIVRSAESAQILGIDEGTPTTGQQIFAKVYPDDRERLTAAMAELSPEKPRLQVSYRTVRPDGTVIWLERNSRAHFDDQGKMLRIVGMVADVTERKRAEAALRESEERLRLAVKAGRMYAFEWDPVTDVIVRSGECADILHWMDDPTLDTGRHFAASIHPDDREAFAVVETTGISPENSTYQCGFRLLRPDGSVIWLEERGHASFDDQGKLLRIMGMVADVTARKRAEETLRRRDAELAEAQRLARVASWQWDPETDTVTWSEELYRITGLNPNLPAVSYKEHPKLYTAESWERLRHAVEETLRTGKPYELDVEMVRPDGTTIWLIARGEAQRDTTGRIVRLRGTVQDITERKGAEQALLSMSGRLITAHEQERTRIARELHDDLSQRMALLQIGLEQFEQDTTGLLSKDRQNLHNIVEVASEVSSNIHNLSHQLHPFKLDTLGLVASLRGLCKEFSAQHSLQVQFVNNDIPGQIPKNVALCLFRIVQEALRNVVKHSGAAEAKVELSCHGDRIDLCISDPGVGFNSESAKGEAGLGLTSMRERLRLVGGHLSIESEPSHGSRISVRVPLPTTDAQVTSEGKAHRAGARATGTLGGHQTETPNVRRAAPSGSRNPR